MLLFTKTLIIKSILKGHCSFNELIQVCEGIEPFELAKRIDELIESGDLIKIDDEVYSVKEGTEYISPVYHHAEITTQLPHPHPLDYDWRFTENTTNHICMTLISQCHTDSQILLLGCPSVWLMLQQFDVTPHSHLIDWNDEMISSLKRMFPDSSNQMTHHNLLANPILSLRNTADVVFCDPPWYPEHYHAFITQAAQAAQIGSYVYLSLLPSNTRPNAIQDRWDIISYAQSLGLEIYELRPHAIEYQSPLFELASSYFAQRNLPKNWRKADLLILRKTIATTLSEVSFTDIHEEEWDEVVIGRKKIKIRGPFDDDQDKPDLISIEKNNLLPTVSRRYKGRKLVDLWLWDNRVFKLSGHNAFRAALYIRAGRNLSEDVPISMVKIQEAQDQLDQILGPYSKLVAIQSLLNYFARTQGIVSIIDLEQICRRYQLGGHVAIMTQPYLNKVISGAKTIESRFSKNRIAPYRKVEAGDVIFLKESAGSLLAIVQISQINFEGPMSPGQAETIIDEHNQELLVDDSFKELKKGSRYATLMHLGELLSLYPLKLDKIDRRSWIVLNDQRQTKLF